MSSRGKPKVTMAKLTREAKLRERRVEKQARKDARLRTAGAPPEQRWPTDEDGGPQPVGSTSAQDTE